MQYKRINPQNRSGAQDQGLTASPAVRNAIQENQSTKQHRSGAQDQGLTASPAVRNAIQENQSTKQHRSGVQDQGLTASPAVRKCNTRESIHKTAQIRSTRSRAYSIPSCKKMRYKRINPQNSTDQEHRIKGLQHPQL